MSSNKLDEKSTALDVLETLQNEKKLASYVKKGGTAIVTGGNAGIGFVSVETLALAGMKVVLCARDVEKAEEKVKTELKSTKPDIQKNVRVQKLDLADLSSIKSAVEEIIANEGGQIDVLLNNAGVLGTPTRVETSQGFELQLGTNHIGHHMFTRLLLPYMRDEGRVVTVASMAHLFGALDLEDLNYQNRSYNPMDAYKQSKLANVLFAKALDDKLKESEKKTGIISCSLHPGVIKTNLYTDVPKFSKPFDKNVEQGAATSVFCCISDSSSFKGGDYFSDCNITTPSTSGQDSDKKLRNALWDETEKLIKGAGFELPTDV